MNVLNNLPHQGHDDHHGPNVRINDDLKVGFKKILNITDAHLKCFVRLFTH